MPAMTSAAEPSRATPCYDDLRERHARLHRFGHLDALAQWDRSACMPAGGAQARTAALAELATLMHRLRTDPALGDALDRAQAEPLTDAERANLREMRRDWRRSTTLPEALVQRDRKSTRLNSSHHSISYAVFC